MKAVDNALGRIAAFNPILAGVGAVILCGWIVVLCWPLAVYLGPVGLFLMFLFMALGLIVHFVALHTGNYIVSWGASSFFGLIALAAVGVSKPSNRLALALVAGVSILAYNESVRLSYAHRRYAKIDHRVFFSSGAVIAVVAVLSAIGIQFARLGVNIQPTTFDGVTLAPNNWWTLVSVVVLIAGFFTALLLPTFGLGRQKLRRFRPGLRVDFDDIEKPEKQKKERRGRK